MVDCEQIGCPCHPKCDKFYNLLIGSFSLLAAVFTIAALFIDPAYDDGLWIAALALSFVGIAAGILTVYFQSCDCYHEYKLCGDPKKKKGACCECYCRDWKKTSADEFFLMILTIIGIFTPAVLGMVFIVNKLDAETEPCFGLCTSTFCNLSLCDLASMRSEYELQNCNFSLCG